MLESRVGSLGASWLLLGILLLAVALGLSILSLLGKARLALSPLRSLRLEARLIMLSLLLKPLLMLGRLLLEAMLSLWHLLVMSETWLTLMATLLLVSKGRLLLHTMDAFFQFRQLPGAALSHIGP